MATNPILDTESGALPAGRTIVVADDDRRVRRYLSLVLRNSGFRVLEAANGAQAQSLIREHRELVSLVICDIDMPGVSGLDVAAQLDAVIARLPLLPVLLISGLLDSVAVQGILLSQPPAILTKPFTAEALLARVHGLIGPTSQAASTPPGAKLPHREARPPAGETLNAG